MEVLFVYTPVLWHLIDLHRLMNYYRVLTNELSLAHSLDVMDHYSEQDFERGFR